MALFDRFHGEERNPDEVRMTLGEHLEELRSRIIRCLIALVLGAVVCFYFIDQIEGVLTSALFDVMRRQGYPADMMYTSITETFVADFQIALILGFILTAPYILTQMWGFVAAGLYRHERKWVRRFVPVSIGLFFAGAIFFLVVVVPMFLDFFIGYKKDLPQMHPYVDVFNKTGSPTASQPAVWPVGIPGVVQEFSQDPPTVPSGALWINHSANELRTRIGDKTFTVGVLKEAGRNRISPMIQVQEYLIFILQMAAAFGAGFQVPVVVALIATLGIANASQMAKARRYVWFAIAVAAALITPAPDASTMLLMVVPMIALVEAGLVTARLIERERAGKVTSGT